MRTVKIRKVNCILTCCLAASMLALGSHLATAQGCVTTPPHPLECYEYIVVRDFSWNWPPPGAVPICPDGVPRGETDYYVRNNKCPAKPKCLSCGDAGAPINLASGDTYIGQTDIRLPGLGGGLTLSRTWNSILFDGFAQLGMFGFRWTSNFEESVYVGGDGLIEYQRGDGGIWRFANGGSDPDGVPYVPVSAGAGWPSIRAKALSRA